MLSFSSYALDVMRDGGRPALRAVLGLISGAAEISFDLRSPLDGSSGVLRTSIDAETYEPDLSSAFVTCVNDDDRFSPDVAGSLFNGVDYIGTQLSIYVGVVLPTGGIESIALFSGRLAYVEYSTDERTAEFKAVDALEALSNTSVGDTEGTVLADDCPSALILKLLGTGYANVLSFVDVGSFSSQHFSERSERVIVRGFTVERGSWLTNIQRLLGYAGDASLRVSASGFVSYAVYRPTTTGLATETISPSTCLKSLRWYSDLAAIRNRVVVTHSDGAGDFVKTAHSPIEDSASMSLYGVRWDETKQFDYFTEDHPAEQAAAQRLFFRTNPVRFYEVVAQFEAIRFEPGDFVQLKEAGLGPAGKQALVVSREYDPNSTDVKLVAIDSIFTNRPWIFADGAKTPNDAGVVW